MSLEARYDPLEPAVDHETRLAVAHSACIMLTLDRNQSLKDAVADAYQVFSAVFPEDKKIGKGAELERSSLYHPFATVFSFTL